MCLYTNISTVSNSQVRVDSLVANKPWGIVCEVAISLSNMFWETCSRGGRAIPYEYRIQGVKGFIDLYYDIVEVRTLLELTMQEDTQMYRATQLP